ncbi:hypothetical protein [Desulfuromonas thiophila]|uniref:Uncharacterized protein n=1 Tax=Desulfuromonas thiophila TaxID=57664 RepID=A0A1G7B3L4_9BACT|nr:hypothetical protein [Desulfuromonas thiophila]SDE21698.1 hypothetical protein SAMN05661003_10551 [Desulfuromonas thiophila]
MNPTRFFANLLVSALPADASDDAVIGAALAGLAVFGILLCLAVYSAVRLLEGKK